MGFKQNSTIANRYTTNTSVGFDGYALITGSSPLGATDTSSVGEARGLGFLCTNQLASSIYVGVYDGNAQPNANDVPICEVLIAAHSQGSLDSESFNGINVTKGIVIAASSTSGKYTAAASSMFLTCWWIK